MAIALTLALAALVAAFIGAPLLLRRPLPHAYAPATSPLDGRRQQLLADLYDLDLAFHARRVSGRDYRRLRAELEGELAGVLRQIDMRVEVERDLHASASEGPGAGPGHAGGEGGAPP